MNYKNTDEKIKNKSDFSTLLNQNIKNMKKNLPLYLYGTMIIIGGIFLLFSPYYNLQTVRYTLGIALIIGAIFALLTAFSRQRKHSEFAYHEMHAMAMMVYGLSVLLFANTLETLKYLSTFLFFFYTFSEIAFCNWLFNLNGKANYKILLVRLFLGIIAGLGTVVIMYYPHNKKIDLEGFGVLFIIIGINVLLYVPIMKTKESKINIENFEDLPFPNPQKKK